MKQELQLPQGVAERILRSQSGQGAVEYILMLVIVVAVALGVLYQFNGAFAKWAVGYFGSYLSCLMETGELPGIGGAAGDSGTCSQLYETFTFTAGSPPRTPPGGGGGGSGGGSGGGGSGSGGEGGTGLTPGSEGSGSGGPNSGRSTYSRIGGKGRQGGGGGFGRDGRFDANGNDKSKSGGGGRGQKNIYTGSSESSLPASALSKTDGRQKVKGSKFERGYYFSEDKDKSKEDKSAIQVRRQKTDNEKRKDKIKIDRKPAKKKQEIEDEEMTFGNFIRILVIAGILIALFLLLGGQALQISKSWE